MQCVDTAFTHAADKACGNSVPPGKHCLSWLHLRKQAAAAANLTAQTALRVRMCDLASQFAARGRFFVNQEQGNIVLHFLYKQFLPVSLSRGRAADRHRISAGKEVRASCCFSRR